MNRCSIVLAALLAVPAAAARAEDGDAAEQVKKLDLLASLAGARGDSQQAEALLRRALAVATTGPGVPGASVARIQSSLAGLLMERGAVREAERLASRARKLYEKTAGPERAELAEALITLAALRASRGELDEAQVLLLRARRVAEIEHARPALRGATVANLGALRMLQGRTLKRSRSSNRRWSIWRKGIRGGRRCSRDSRPSTPPRAAGPRRTGSSARSPRRGRCCP